MFNPTSLHELLHEPSLCMCSPQEDQKAELNKQLIGASRASEQLGEELKVFKQTSSQKVDALSTARIE